ncbi:hypothetical protein CHU98_g5489 [Xylaria longipes]|nr:hypothetical protein CHU98_g5489 [Xylaria longipes]
MCLSDRGEAWVAERRRKGSQKVVVVPAQNTYDGIFNFFIAKSCYNTGGSISNATTRGHGSIREAVSRAGAAAATSGFGVPAAKPEIMDPRHHLSSTKLLTANVAYHRSPSTSYGVTDLTITSHALQDEDRTRFHGLVV